MIEMVHPIKDLITDTMMMDITVITTVIMTVTTTDTITVITTETGTDQTILEVETGTTITVKTTSIGLIDRTIKLQIIIETITKKITDKTMIRSQSDNLTQLTQLMVNQFMEIKVS